ncbi:hypothetical protein Tco_0429778, partial [Tanacetum coccineum]
GPEASGSLPQKRKKAKSKKALTETQVTPPTGPMEGFEQSHSISSGNSADKGLPFTVSDEGTVKTTLLPEGSHGDKDSEGFKLPADMDPLTTLVADPSGTDAKYQADHTQLARLRYQSLIKNKGNTSSEVEPDSKTLQLTAFADTDESDSDSSCPDALKKYDNIFPLTERQLAKYLQKLSQALYDRITTDYWNKHEEVVVSYAGLKASVEDYYDCGKLEGGGVE